MSSRQWERVEPLERHAGPPWSDSRIWDPPKPQQLLFAAHPKALATAVPAA